VSRTPSKPTPHRGRRVLSRRERAPSCRDVSNDTVKPTAVPFARLLAVALVAACGAGDGRSDESEAPILPFDTTQVHLVSEADTSVLRVELAVTDEQKTLGLMARSTLPPDAGMLFLYDATQPDSAGFWMFRTRIPLDIAFLDSAGVIRAIRSMAPCDSTFAASCPTYAAGVPYRAALEVNQGYFARRGIAVGDRAMLAETPRAPTEPSRVHLARSPASPAP
jgi:uncharacterized protein